MSACFNDLQFDRDHCDWLYILQRWENIFRFRNRSDISKKEKKKSKGDDGYRVNWKKLKNKDVVGWIRFKHPKIISYPIMQKDDNDFYLHKNIKKEYSFAGSIFMDYHNHKNFLDSNTLIYGHNMANESMFGSLKKYNEKSYWKKINIFIFTQEMESGENIKSIMLVSFVLVPRFIHTVLLQMKTWINI